MAKLGSSNDKKITFYAIGAIAVLVTCVFGGYFLLSDGGKGSTNKVQPRARPSGSLGSTEGNAAYNQSFQEKVLSNVNATMESFRTENKATMDAFRKEQDTRNTELARKLEETITNALEAKQQAPETQPAQAVEKISIGHTTETKSSPLDGGFLGTPADVKPQQGEIGSASSGEEPRKNTKSEANVPPNGFISGKTLNGVVAVVGAPPVPFLVKLSGRYQSANGFVVNLDGCTVYAEGRADLAAGRVKGKPAKMTCNFPDGGSQTWDVSGYIVDNDGIDGIVGTVNDNSGKKLAGATIAGGISVAGNALSRAQSQTFSGPGGASQAFTGSIGQDIAGGFAQGGGAEIAKQMADYYNAYASSVQVGGNHDVTVVLLNELTVPASGKGITTTRSTPKTGIF